MSDLDNEELEATKRIGKASNKNYISKDKIRKKIQTLKLELEVGKKLFPPAEVCKSLWSDYEHQIEILQELLEEGENDEND